MTTQEMFTALVLNSKNGIRNANGIDVYSVMNPIYDTFGENSTLILTPDGISPIERNEWAAIRRANRTSTGETMILIDTESDGWSGLYFQVV